ncbi:MAG: FkbM family methyltransferase [Coxiella sp. (in: Bacteria)]|nr:MAG: FkbM family methyltransferase [Coxiella sp. (in: g-proteobacteria)]
MITYHHIGGRSGTYPFPLKNNNLLKDFHLVLYDADVDCVSQMESSKNSLFGKESILPYCIGKTSSTANFHLNFHPTTNSLYPFNPLYNDYCYVKDPLYGNYAFGDACKTEETIEVTLFSLADALKDCGVGELDFLSIDTQGAEYDIIVGAKELMRDSCLGIQLEAEFVELYKGQKVFSDIDPLMKSLGFELLELFSFGRCTPMITPIGFRGEEQPIHAEAVYVKSESFLRQHASVEQLYKTALFSLSYNKLGHCLKVLSMIDSTKEPGSDEPMPGYVVFLQKLHALYQGSVHCQLPRLSNLFTNKAFRDYYSGENNHRVVGDDVVSSLQRLLPEMEALTKQEFSPLEILLRDHGFDELAQIARENRRYESQCFFKLVDLYCVLSAV